MSTDLVAKFWNFCHTLRHEGVDYTDYIEELTYLLFLKLAEENKIVVPENCSWKILVETSKDDLLAVYNNILENLSNSKGILADIFMYPIPKIRNANALHKLLILIDGVNWLEYNADILGAMFEGLLEKAASEGKKGAGQYFTPRPLIDAIITVTKPNPLTNNEFKVSDIACGTGGFIISSFEWFKRNHDISSLTKSAKSRIQSITYYGQELVLRPRRMAQMNLYLHGLNPNIKLGDTIYGDYNPEKDLTYDCILTNPPFGTKGADQTPQRNDFLVSTSNKQLNFVQHVYSSLKNGGRAAIVLPDNVLTDDKARELWKQLLQKCNLHTILKLPNGTFQPYANVKAVVIFLQKGKKTSNIWYYDARTGIDPVTKTGRPLNGSYFEDFIKCYGPDPNAIARKDLKDHKRFKKIGIKEIEQRKFDLDISLQDTHVSAEPKSKVTAEAALNSAILEIEGIVQEAKNILKVLKR